MLWAGEKFLLVFGDVLLNANQLSLLTQAESALSN